LNFDAGEALMPGMIAIQGDEPAGPATSYCRQIFSLLRPAWHGILRMFVAPQRTTLPTGLDMYW
jgi:hypothetical protein